MAYRKLNLRIVSPGAATDRKPYKLKKDSDLVIMRCISGDLGVMVGRMPCTMVLGSGVLRSVNDGKEYQMAIMGGIAHVKDDIVTVLTDEALFPEDIDKEQVGSEIRELEQKIQDEEDLALKNRLKSELRGLRIKIEVAR